jgi:hypothetical protein
MGRQQRQGQPPEVGPDLQRAVLAAAGAVTAGDPDAAEAHALALLTSPLHEVPAVLDGVVAALVEGMQGSWRRGWQPVDLHQVVRRRLGREHLGLLRVVLAEALRPYARKAVDPVWREQLAGLGAGVPPAGNALLAWQQSERDEALPGRRGKGPGDTLGAIAVAVELLALLASLGRIAALGPLPGAARPQPGKPRSPVDQKVLTRVRALLAKAESTEFELEAEALSAKAQELMTRYSLERLLVDATDADPHETGARRIWLDEPYAGAKALLVSAVAEANRCAAVWSEDPGFSTVVGDDRDLEATDLMVTSLLVQATRAMLHPEHHQQDRKRSFRQSFLVAYASRIGERLRGANAHVSGELPGAELVPALAALAERVARTREGLFPRTTTTSVAVSNGSGWAAGLAAADSATF